MITDVAGWVSSIAGVLALLVCWIPVIGQALAAVFLLVVGNAASAARINAKAAVEVGARNMGKLTVRQAIRLKPSELADSEGRTRKDCSRNRWPTCNPARPCTASTAARFQRVPRTAPSRHRRWQIRDRRSGFPGSTPARTSSSPRSTTSIMSSSRTTTERPARGCARVDYVPGEFGPVKGVTLLSDTPLRVR